MLNCSCTLGICKVLLQELGVYGSMHMHQLLVNLEKLKRDGDLLASEIQKKLRIVISYRWNGTADLISCIGHATFFFEYQAHCSASRKELQTRKERLAQQRRERMRDRVNDVRSLICPIRILVTFTTFEQYGEDALKEGIDGGGGHDQSDIFILGEDVVQPLKVSLNDLYNVTSKKLSLTCSVLCSKCKGKGSKSHASMKCACCQGSGMKVSYMI
ncbi:DnaJ protein [Tanacetum coccineum]